MTTVRRGVEVQGSPLVSISVVRKASCQYGSGHGPEKRCQNKTKMMLVVPLLDIGPDGTPGLGGFRLCSEHIEDAILKVVAA